MSPDLISPTRPPTPVRRRGRVLAAVVALAGLGEVILIRLGRTYGSTALEQATALPGDDIIDRPAVVTNHAVTIGAAAENVWPWLTQMGWHKGGWYTARWGRSAALSGELAQRDAADPRTAEHRSRLLHP